jgi:hypothetical protein
LRRLIGGSGSEKPQSGFALCAVLSPPDFGNLQTQKVGVRMVFIAFAFAYPVAKTS